MRLKTQPGYTDHSQVPSPTGVIPGTTTFLSMHLLFRDNRCTKRIRTHWLLPLWKQMARHCLFPAWVWRVTPWEVLLSKQVSRLISETFCLTLRPYQKNTSKASPTLSKLSKELWSLKWKSLCLRYFFALKHRGLRVHFPQLFRIFRTPIWHIPASCADITQWHKAPQTKVRKRLVWVRCTLQAETLN